VSGFIHNLVRRGAGLEPVATVRPPWVPNFAPTLSTRMRRHTPGLVEGIRETREQPHREASQEKLPPRVSGAVSSPAGSALPAHEPIQDSEPTDLPPLAQGRRADARRSTQGPQVQRLSEDSTDPHRVIEPSRGMSPSQDSQAASAATIRVNKAQQTEAGSGSRPAHDLPPGSPTGSSPELRAASEPERAPVTESSFPSSDDPSRTRVRASEETREQHTPTFRSPVVEQVPGDPTAAVAETGMSASRAPRGEIAMEAGNEQAPFRLEQTPSGEQASAGQPAPRSLARFAPTSSPVAAGPASVSEPEPGGRRSVVRPEPARPAGLTPMLQRPTERPEREPIHVRIGTVEVRATTPAPAPPLAPVPQGFDDYAAIRCYAGWG
jgi:hypothetical protein